MCELTGISNITQESVTHFNYFTPDFWKSFSHTHTHTQKKFQLQHLKLFVSEKFHLGDENQLCGWKWVRYIWLKKSDFYLPTDFVYNFAVWVWVWVWVCRTSHIQMCDDACSQQNSYCKISNTRRTNSQNLIYSHLVLSCSCLCLIHWSQVLSDGLYGPLCPLSPERLLNLITLSLTQVLSQQWRCSWSNADRRCSNYIWVTNNLIAY